MSFNTSPHITLALCSSDLMAKVMRALVIFPTYTKRICYQLALLTSKVVQCFLGKFHNSMLIGYFSIPVSIFKIATLHSVAFKHSSFAQFDSLIPALATHASFSFHDNHVFCLSSSSGMPALDFPFADREASYYSSRFVPGDNNRTLFIHSYFSFSN